MPSEQGPVGLVWAQSRDGVIGARGSLPWHLPEDLARFRQLTLASTVVMGRATWESLPARFRPLPGRHNVVLTRDPAYAAPGAEVATSLDAALRRLGPVWVIGGGEVYAAAEPYARRAVVTEVDVVVQGDTWAPELGPAWRLVTCDPRTGWHRSGTGLAFRVQTFERNAP